MSNSNQVTQQFTAYVTNVKGNKSELFKLFGLLLLAIYLTSKFLGSFDSTLNYDIRGEFSGYLLLLSFFIFLFISHKHKDSDGLKLTSFLHLLTCLTNFVIIKSLSTLILLKLITAFASILLLLILLREIKNRG
jgi:hypothetical protein